VNIGEAKPIRDLSTAVFRVLQEALTNVARHAGAERVDVRLEVADGSLLLQVCDDGKGIRNEAINDPRSLGLLGMRERARRLGGTVTFAQRETRGTAVTFRWPLSVPEPTVAGSSMPRYSNP
jgi:signal transduction histidine kinase